MLFRAFWMLVLLGAFLPLLPPPIQGQSAAEKAENLPEGKGKDIVEKVCNQCHALAIATGEKQTLEEWRVTVKSGMDVADGTPLTEEEVETVAQYLVKNFGPESASAGTKEKKEANAASEAKEASSNPKINVNKSTTKELETDLGLSEKEAEAIIGYREKHGDFKSWEDLKKVDGLDTTKIEGVKDRLVF